MRWGALLLTLGCSSEPPTQLVLTVDQMGLNVPGDIDTVHVNVGSDKPMPEAFLSIGVALCAALPTAGCRNLPLTFSFVPGPNRPNDNVRVEVLAKLGGDGDPAAVRISDVMSFHFVHGQSQRLGLALTTNCLDDAACAAAETACGPSGCFALAPSPAGAVTQADLGQFTVTQ